MNPVQILIIGAVAVIAAIAGIFLWTNMTRTACYNCKRIAGKCSPVLSVKDILEREG